MAGLKYILVTPARNEVRFIESLITSVVVQTVRPIKWVIVSDGSTDGTDEVVIKYSSEYSWIELIRMPHRSGRDFAGKVHAFNAGYARIRNLQYDAIGSVDADISFDSDYFAFLLTKLTEDPCLGLVGTPFEDGSHKTYDYRFTSIEHVSGACQLFRRECFEQIGGYVPVKAGGIDQLAVLAARMKGWKTRTFTEKVCQHHREMGTAVRGELAARFSQGIKDYAFGSHPIWELFRFAYQMTRRPMLLGGLALGSGYFWAAVQRLERPIPGEMVAFRRNEQMLRLKKCLLRGNKRPINGEAFSAKAACQSSRRPSL
jgi:biofilm PGA synthesis N-glycosyltransferase PgaC